MLDSLKCSHSRLDKALTDLVIVTPEPAGNDRTMLERPFTLLDGRTTTGLPPSEKPAPRMELSVVQTPP